MGLWGGVSKCGGMNACVREGERKVGKGVGEREGKMDGEEGGRKEGEN